MNLLLDTHAFIWFINGDEALPDKLKVAIQNLDNRCFLSIASLWEMAIKVSLGKLELKADFKQIAEFMEVNEIEVLPITFVHLQMLLKLDFHHRDPFDRIIIAQGAAEELTVLSKDESFSKYDIMLLWE